MLVQRAIPGLLEVEGMRNDGHDQVGVVDWGQRDKADAIAKHF